MNVDDLCENMAEGVMQCVRDTNLATIESNDNLNGIVTTLRKERDELQLRVNAIPKQMKQAEKDGIASMFNGFYVRDKVWVINQVPTRSDCITCNGIGKVCAKLGDDDVYVVCPSCNGDKHTTSYTPTPTERKICTLSYEISDRGIKNAEFRNVYFDRVDFKGDVNKLYISEEECQKAIDSMQDVKK